MSQYLNVFENKTVFITGHNGFKGLVSELLRPKLINLPCDIDERSIYKIIETIHMNMETLNESK